MTGWIRSTTPHHRLRTPQARLPGSIRFEEEDTGTPLEIPCALCRIAAALNLSGLFIGMDSDVPEMRSKWIGEALLCNMNNPNDMIFAR